MTLSEKSAYLKGLADGMKLDTQKVEGKLISELISLVSDIAGDVDAVKDETSELSGYVDELDRDLGDLEEYVYDEEYDDDDDEFFDSDDDEFDYGEYDDDDDDEEEECNGVCEGCEGCGGDAAVEGMRCVMCDNCGDTVCYDETLDPAEIVCPSCGRKIVGAEEE